MSNVSTEGLGSESARKYLLWFFFALPGIYMVGAGFAGAKIPYVNWSGQVAGWFLAATLLVTPLQLLFGPISWLRSRRRYMGVASFWYSVLHLAFWLVHASFWGILRSFIRLDLTWGWMAFFIMIPLAATSFDSAVRKMGRKWKSLQRWVYLAAALTLLHWILSIEGFFQPLLAATPVIVLSIWRYVRYRRRMAA